MRPARLVVSAVLLLAAGGIAAVVSVSEGLPAEWGRGFAGGLAVHGDPHDVLGGFLTWRGTALAPPLVLLIVLAALALLAASRGAWQRLGVVGLTAFGAAATVGYLGEPLTRRVLVTDFDPAKALLVAAEFVLCVLLVAFGVLELRGRRTDVRTSVGYGVAA